MHFTYDPPKGDLSQGDILLRTPELEAVLKTAHPHYIGGNYKYFMVVTQSCDLVRRDGGECKTRYINIATVRPLATVLRRYLAANLQDGIDVRAGVCSNKKQDKFTQFVERLLNNNESEYFYLEQQSDFGFAEDMCGFLRETITLSAESHYGVLVSARRISLRPMFQAKLGWLIGQVFARVATDDWIPEAVRDQKAFDEVVRSKAAAVCEWVDDRKLRAVKKQITNPAALSDDEIREKIDTAKGQSHRSEVLDRVVAVLQKNYPQQFQQATNVRQALGSDPDLKTFLGA